MAKLDDYIERFEVRVLESTAGQQLLARYRGLSDYEQLLAKTVIMVVSLALIVAVLVLPPLGYANRARSEYTDARDDLAWINSHAGRAHTAVLAAHSAGTDNESLLNSITTSAGRHGIKFRRFAPSGQNAARVWIDDVSFDQLTQWLDDLLRNGTLVLEKITITHGTQPHIVSARIQLRG